MKPIAFFSCKLNDTKKGYATLDKELLALHKATRHFHHLLEERPFTARTDHLPLIHAFVKPKDAWSARIRRQLSELAEYKCSLQYIKGTDNEVADTLSRNFVSSIQLGISYADISKSQSEAATMISNLKKKSSLQLITHHFDDLPIVCDMSTG